MQNPKLGLLVLFSALALFGCGDSDGSDEFPREAVATDPGPMPPPGVTDAWVLYAQAKEVEVNPSRSLSDEIHFAVTEGWKDTEGNLESFLDQNEVAITETKRATRVLGCELPQGDELPEGTVFVATALQSLGGLLLLEARQLENQRQHERSLQNYLAVLRIANHLRQDANVDLVSLYVAWGLENQVQERIQEFLHRSRIGAPAWRSASNELETLREGWDRLEQAYANDREGVDEEWLDSLAEETDAESYELLRQHYNELDREVTELFVEAHRTGSSDALSARLEALETEVEGGPSFLALLNKGRELEYSAKMIMSMRMERIVDVIGHSRVALARFEILRGSVASRVYYDDHGRETPPSLEAMVPDYLAAVPLDPFTDGEPLGLRRDETHWWLYSIGPDRSDQKGEVILRGWELSSSGDVVCAPFHDGH